jgi:Transposase DDE domain group 1
MEIPVQVISLHAQLRRALAGHQVGGDYGCAHLAVLVIGLLAVGMRRLRHLGYLAHDCLFVRFCGLTRLPSDRTVVNWLKQFSQASLGALARLNRELLDEQIEQLKLARLTIDLDGTVICTGAKVAWAARGYNPHHRKNPSYYPLLAHLAQTGQILKLKNRPGNVHDSKGAEAFVRQLIAELRARFGRALPLEFPYGCGLFPAQAARSRGLLLCGQGPLH